MSLKHCPYCGTANLSVDIGICPKCETDIGRDNEPPGTRLQSVAGLRGQIRETRTPTFVQGAPSIPQGERSPDVTPFRPLHRPPMAIICLNYDGSATEGEELCVRNSVLTMGRTEADILIPHDEQISKTHVKLERQFEDGQYAWTITDLGSTNGTFALVDEAVLRHGQELLLGSHRYVFTMTRDDAGYMEKSGASQGQTSAWQSIAPALRPPPLAGLQEVTAAGSGGIRHDFIGRQVVFGSDAGNCSIHISGDAFLGPRHANFLQDQHGRWMVKPIQAINGVWLRIHSIRVGQSGRFQIGEQRFSVRIP